MKEFEKQFPREFFSTKSDQELVDYWREKQKQGWLAVLKWLRTELTDDGLWSGVITGYTIRNLIDKELKESK